MRRSQGARLLRADWNRIEPWLDRARNDIALADEQAIKSVLRSNPEAIRIIEDKRNATEKGLFCYLPLNELGAMAIVSGAFSGASPSPEHLSQAGETPVAIYIWLIYAPGQLVLSIGAIGELVAELAPRGCPFFSRAVTSHAERLNRTLGFIPARDIYPGAPEWLLASLPEREMNGRVSTTGRSEIEVRSVRTLDELARVYAVRTAVYMAEQLCRHDEEFDGNDLCATHLLGLVDGDAAGCARLRWFGDFAKLERVAVRPEYRRTRLAYKLARAALDHCRFKGFTRVYGHSRADLVPFWKIFGFRPIKGRPAFSFANVEYREIVVDLDPAENAIRFGSHPMVTIRQEGRWDKLGPLELSNIDASTETAGNIDSKTRWLAA